MIEIVDVSYPKVKPDELRGYGLSAPRPGKRSDVYSIGVSGWVLGRSARVVAVELLREGDVLRSTPARGSHRSATLRHPGAPGLDSCRFVAEVGVLGMPLDSTIELHAVLEDGPRVSFGAVRFKRQPIRTDFQPTLQPIMVTSLGRTGTTYVMRLLMNHPRVARYNWHPYEIRPGGYWMHMLKVLSEPANTDQSANPDTFWGNSWWVGSNPYYGHPATLREEARQWIGRSYVEQLASFCQRSIDSYYRRFTDVDRRPDASHFAEKCMPNHIPWLFWELYPETREIILIRDVRDVVCSMLAFNAKRGHEAFGRENSASDEEFVKGLRYSVSRLARDWKSRFGQAYLLRYEDLVLRPTETVRPLLAHLGLGLKRADVERLVARASRTTADTSAHRTSRDAASSVGRWRRDLPPKLLQLCRRELGDLLEEFGYGIEGKG
jgi:hypothetical protein